MVGLFLLIGLMAPVYADQCCGILELQCDCNSGLQMLDDNECSTVSSCDTPAAGSHFTILAPTFELKALVRQVAVREVPVPPDIELAQEVETDSYDRPPPPLFVNLNRCSLPPPIS